jgi:hypothetical protein
MRCLFLYYAFYLYSDLFHIIPKMKTMVLYKHQ